MVVGLSQLIKPLRVCKECLNGKQQRDPFPKTNNSRTEFPLLFILIYVVLLNPISTAIRGISSLMIVPKIHGSIFYMRNLKHSIFSRNLKPSKEIYKLNVFAQIVKENSFHHNSQIFVLNMESTSNSLLRTHSSKKVSLKEKNRNIMNVVRNMMIAKSIPSVFCQKLLIGQFMFLTEVQH